MKTSMLGRTKREVLAARWPEVMAKGARGKGGEALTPGDAVRLPAAVRLGERAGWDACGTDVIVIDSKEAWRLEAMYDRSGRPRPRDGGRTGR